MAMMAAKEKADADKIANRKSAGEHINTLMDDGGDDFLKKWSGPMLLGPLVPFIFAAFICVGGEIILTFKEGQCNFPIDLVVQSQIVVSYLFILVYSWIWLGDAFYFEIEALGIKKAIFYPFQSMKWLMFYYLVIFTTAMIIMAVATAILNLAFLCLETTPKLYSFLAFVLTIYWIMFVIIMLKMVGLTFGSSIVSFLKDKTTAPSQNELEERIFRKKFADFDRNKEQQVDAADFPQLLQELGVYIPDEEQPALLRTLDPEKSGKIAFDPMFEWFQKISVTSVDDGGNNDDDDDDDDDDAIKQFQSKKGR